MGVYVKCCLDKVSITYFYISSQFTGTQTATRCADDQLLPPLPARILKQPNRQMLYIYSNGFFEFSRNNDLWQHDRVDLWFFGMNRHRWQVHLRHAGYYPFSRNLHFGQSKMRHIFMVEGQHGTNRHYG